MDEQVVLPDNLYIFWLIHTSFVVVIHIRETSNKTTSKERRRSRTHKRETQRRSRQAKACKISIQPSYCTDQLQKQNKKTEKLSSSTTEPLLQHPKLHISQNPCIPQKNEGMGMDQTSFRAL